MSFMDILNKYAGVPQPQADTPAHFDEVAQSAPAPSLGGAIASMFRSDSTPPFGQSVGTLFNQSNPQQRAGLLNQIIQSLGPAAAMGAGGGILSRVLGAAGSSGASPTVTPEQASQVSASDVTALANHAEQQNPSVVDNVGSFYSQHPALVKTLGVAALAVVLGHMRK
jgi:hypothetical protein